MLTTIYSTYYPPPAGTACRRLMNDSLTETDPAQCPNANATIACFNVSPLSPTLILSSSLPRIPQLPSPALYHSLD